MPSDMTNIYRRRDPVWHATSFGPATPEQPWHYEFKPPKSFTERLSSLSDWICKSLIAHSAREYAEFIGAPKYFIEMLFLIEDKRFPVHFGIDPIAIARAAAFNLRSRALQGGSTITQQVITVRMSGSKRISRSLRYKLTQIARALCESTARNKISILKEYVETVYWGRSYHGLDSAASGYFGADRGSLSVAQSFFLAERIAAPNRISPKRISNLLRREPIRMQLVRNGETLAGVSRVYEQVYGHGSGVW
jgi:membrane peptidoglycan carboxypeptidase